MNQLPSWVPLTMSERVWVNQQFHLIHFKMLAYKMQFVNVNSSMQNPLSPSSSSAGPYSPYPWDYWPHEDGRSDCGYVGLTNLGATCYMASCMQHLYMMPQARAEILSAQVDTCSSKHQSTLRELQRMFAYLLVSTKTLWPLLCVRPWLTFFFPIKH